ncbi:MAG: SusC/RagA family TonB-linked outer membrane protein, partial [Cyclobacteriaceae bacterium]
LTGVAASAHKIQIRGQNSLRTDANYPLYVIDGVPMDSRPIQSANSLLIGGIDPLSALNPEDIESIEVLKDADATAIYGSRGANGVILITTKRGREGTTDLNIQTYAGAGQVSRTMQLLTTEQYIAMRNEAFANDGPAALADLNNPDYAIYFPDLKIWSQTEYTDWQEELLGSTAQITNAQVSLSGGNAATSFRLGGGYHKETTVFPGDFGYEKATMHANLRHVSPNKKLTVSLSINYGRDENALINDNFVYVSLTLPPNAPTHDELGNLVWLGYDFNAPNPYSRLEVKHTAKTNNLISSGRFTYEVLPDLKIVANLGLSDIKTQQVINTPYVSMAPGTTAPNSSTFADRTATAWTAEPQLSYTKSMSGHNVDVLVGSTWQNSSTDSRWIRGVGYLSDELLGNLNAASQVLKLSADNTMYRYNALFGRVGYNFDSRYFVNLTARRDGSSRFGPDNKFANFGAVGIAWIFSNEGFIKDVLAPLSFGKLRGSYGTTGNDQIGDYGYLSTYSSSSATYQGSSILIPSGPANPEYAWEINRKMEFAIDLGFFKDRISLAANYYLNKSSNQLVGYPLPSLAGFRSVRANLDAVVQNSGWEFILRSENIKADNSSWNTAINLTIPRNRLLSYPDLESSSYANTYEVGQPLTILKLYHLTHVDPQTGLYQFTDTDDNGVINTQDRKTIIDIGRQYYGGLANIIRYRSFEISLFAEFVKQRVRGYFGTFLQAPGAAMNQPAFIPGSDRWMAAGDEAQIQKLTNDQRTYNLARNSDMNVDDGSFIRMKTVTLSYRLPVAWLNRIHLKDATVFVHGQNLFLITKYKGLDPEIPGNSQLPQLRIVTAGLSLKL